MEGEGRTGDKKIRTDADYSIHQGDGGHGHDHFRTFLRVCTQVIYKQESGSRSHHHRMRAARSTTSAASHFARMKVSHNRVTR